MAAIDSLLRVMVLRDAEAMVVTTGQAPSLRRAGNAEPMAMPALDAAMVAGFVAEVVPAEARAELEARRTGEYPYTSAAGDAVTVAVELKDSGHRLVIRRAAGKAAARPAAPSPAAASFVAPAAAAFVAPPPAAVFVTPAAPPAPQPVASHAPASHPPVELPASIRRLVAEASGRRASDLLLSEGLVPHLRVDGDVVTLDDAPMSADELAAALTAFAGFDAVELVRTRGSVDFGADVDDVRLRGHGFGHERGLGLALRLIRRDVPSLRQLALPEDLADLVKLRSGLVLVAGPTGSGKSTTLVALVAHLNRTRPRHVITLEDPIEYQYTPDRCLIHQREIGVHTPTFADGLRAALREAPDVIVVGELRDRETIGIAMTAAETGHLVLGTVHAPGAGVAIDRLIDAYPEHQQRQARTQLAAVLRSVVTQHLLPTRTGGRAPAIERVPVTSAVAALIRKNELQMLGATVQTGRDVGMLPLERSLARLVRANTIDLATARSVAADLDLLEHSLRAG